ncbi:MAG: hypothetical protein Q4E22_04390 [Coriobacteriia bacterium]|nr:hypothetical protein [Coriobacteriia bacterium]
MKSTKEKNKSMSKRTPGQRFTAVMVLAFAYVGVLVGAGFASGQEILQYFVAHGVWGIVGAVVSIFFFALTGMILLQIGSKYNSNSHGDALRHIASPKIGKFLDISIMLTLIILGIVMIAGAGSNLEQQFGLPLWFGSALCAAAIILVSFMDTNKVIGVISVVTPVLILFVMGSAIYSIAHAQASVSELVSEASLIRPATPNWLLSALNYLAFNLMTGASMAIVMGGDEEKPKVAGRGGFIGGALIGIMIVLVSLALLFQIREVAGEDMPLLALIDLIHPALGALMSLVLYLMIFNTGLSVFYSFVSRLAPNESKKFNMVMIVCVIIAFIVSFVGFKTLLSFFYPLIGYVGFALIIVLLSRWLKNTHRRMKIAKDDSNDLGFFDTKI